MFFALGHSLTAAIVTAVVFLVYQEVENHVLNPLIMSRTVKVSPLLVMVSVLIGADLGNWLGGIFGAFTAALLAIPVAGMAQIVVKDLWHATSGQAGPTPERGVGFGVSSTAWRTGSGFNPQRVMFKVIYRGHNELLGPWASEDG